MRIKRLLLGIAAAGIGTGLFFVARANYLLFHIVIEFIAITVGALIFMISVHARKYDQKSFIITLGPGIMVVSVHTFLHAITFRGMNVIGGYDADLPTQLWIILSFALVANICYALLFVHAARGHRWLVWLNLAYAAVMTTLCFTRLFPACYVEGTGLTAFKIVCEYVIIAFYGFAVYLLVFVRRNRFSGPLFRAMLAVIVFFALGEFMFTLYRDVTGFANFAGHFLRTFGFILIYRFIVSEGITKPYDNVFAELNELSLRDGLTNLYNHRALLGFLAKAQADADRTGKHMYLTVLDIDDFKAINDTYGHSVGDDILKATARTIRDKIRVTDIVARQGGDEFSIIFYDTDDATVRAIMGAIRSALTAMPLSAGEVEITISGGIARYAGGSVDAHVRQADRLLYEAKLSGKDRFAYAADIAGHD